MGDTAQSLVIGSLARAAFVGAIVALAPIPARAHPLHTTYTELTFSADGGSTRALIRVFADDFTATVLKAYPAGQRSPREFERAAYTYVAHHFQIAALRGSPYALGWCGLRKDANFIWLCVGSDHLPAGNGLQLMNQLLSEVFTDQINVVRSSSKGRTRHLLFIVGDRFKSLD